MIHGSYSDTTNPMFIGELNCTGSETAVWQCAHNNVSASETCNPAAVVCQPEHGKVVNDEGKGILGPIRK